MLGRISIADYGAIVSRKAGCSARTRFGFARMCLLRYIGFCFKLLSIQFFAVVRGPGVSI